MTPNEIARNLGLSPKTVRAKLREMAREGKLAHGHYDRWILTEDQVNAYLRWEGR